MKKHILQIIAGVVCLAPAAVSAQEAEQEYAPMLVEGRVWEYWNRGLTWFYIEKITLQGESVVNGVKYHILRGEKGDNLLIPGYNSDYVERYAFLVRENNKMVFRYNTEDGSETLLYDFNKTAGEKYDYAKDDPERTKATFTVKRCEWEYDENHDKKRFVQELDVEGESVHYIDTFYFIWPFGIVNCGTFADFQIGPWAADGSQPIRLMRVTDPDGTVLYYDASLDPAGVGSVITDSKADKRKYDLNGREIRDPEPGTVYIQGGRKHVAPRR